MYNTIAKIDLNLIVNINHGILIYIDYFCVLRGPPVKFVIDSIDGRFFYE